MGAEALGRQLLSEVKEETLDKLLKSLRNITNPQKPPFGLPPLDTILDAFENPPATRQQEIYRDRSSPDPLPHPPIKDKPPSVLEITGATSCSGKTQLLYSIISIALLPATYNGTTLNGKGQAAALFDLSSRLSILRLQDVMDNIIATRAKEQSVPLDNKEIAALISDSLMHLHVFEPHSTPSLLSALASLPTYLLAEPSPHSSSSRSLGLLAIMDLSTFLHQDRLDAEDAVLLTTNTASVTNTSDNLLHTRYRTLVSHLRHIHSIFSCTIIATNYGLTPTSSVLGQPALKPHLPAVWTNLCTARIVVEREKVKKFGPAISVEEAERERGMRMTAVKEAGSRAWVNWWGAEEWREGVTEAVRRLPRRGAFGFEVDGRGVRIKS